MARLDAALVLFTLTPEAEGMRKPLGLGRAPAARALFASLIDHVASLSAGLADTDLLVATEAPARVPPGAFELRQRGGDFGESLRFAIEDAFALGYRRVAVIGNDAPDITTEYLRSAFAKLASDGKAHAVLGPALDGGYNLLGLTSPCPAAFESVPWGSREVSQVTAEKLRACGFQLSKLAPLEDIDSARVLARFVYRILGAGRRAPRALRRLASRIRCQRSPQRWLDENESMLFGRLYPADARRSRAPPALFPATL